jgi:hypothetical protein
MPRMVEARVEVERDEVEEVLEVLRELIGRGLRPFIRTCLEDACADIAHLAGRDGEPATVGEAAREGNSDPDR